MRKALALAAAIGIAMPQAQAREVDGTALARAIGDDDLAETRAALTSSRLANAPLGYGESPLARAIETQDPAMVDLLLAGGAKVNASDALGRTPLSLACEHGNGAIVGRLLDARPSLKPGADGTGPLAVCARFAPTATVVRMLAMGAKADLPDSRGQTPLMWAASAGNAEAVVALLKAGAQINRTTPSGFTPLFFAVKNGSVAATNTLLEAGAEAGHRGPENTSALQLALYQHNWDAAYLLTRRDGFDLTELDRNGEQPLHVAARGGDIALVGLLLDKRADPNGLTGPSRIKWVTEANFGVAPAPIPPTPPLLIAAQAGRVATMKLLVARGANPAFVAANGSTVVLAAAAGHSAEALDYALSLAPDVDVADAKGHTALHLVLGGGIDPGLGPMLAVLAAHHARTDIPDKNGHTAAQNAASGLTPVKIAFDKVFAPSSPPPSGMLLPAVQKQTEAQDKP